MGAEKLCVGSVNKLMIYVRFSFSLSSASISLHCSTSLNCDMSLHHFPLLMWCNDSESRGHPGNQVHIYQVPLDSFSGALFLNVKHTWRAFTRPETNTCYGNNLDNSWIVVLEECCQLQKYFTLLKTCALLSVIVNACTHPAHVSLLHFYTRQVLRWKIKVQYRPTWWWHVHRLFTATLDSQDTQRSVTSDERIHRWLSFMSNKSTQTQPLNESCGSGTFQETNMISLFEKGALRLPEYFCLFIWLLKLFQPVVYWARDKENSCVKQYRLCESASFRSYLYRGRRRWPQATLNTLPLLMAPRLICQNPIFSFHNLH